MARPIEPTPIITGRDAEMILEKMREEERSPNPQRIEFLRRCEKTYREWEAIKTKAKQEQKDAEN